MDIFRFKGTSMLPTLKGGDILVLDTKKERPLKCCDLVVFEKDNEKICHRIIFKYKIAGKRYFLEKGDNNLNAHVLKEKNVLGRVKKIHRNKDTFYPTVNNFYKFYIFSTYCVFAILRKIKRALFGNKHFRAAHRFEKLPKMPFALSNIINFLKEKKE